MRATAPWDGLKVASLAMGLVCLMPGRVMADTWSTVGLSFSDERGGGRLLGASGTGSRADPIVLIEEIDGAGPAVLVVRNHRSGDPGISPALGVLRLAVVKIVANRGPWAWSGFELELQRTADRPSGYTDGLSFDQPQTFARAARADRFALSRQDDEPFDRIRFDGGRVDPGQRLRLTFDIVDVNGAPAFYLVQRPLVLFARALATEIGAAAAPDRRDCTQSTPRKILTSCF